MPSILTRLKNLDRTVLALAEGMESPRLGRRHRSPRQDDLRPRLRLTATPAAVCRPPNTRSSPSAHSPKRSPRPPRAFSSTNRSSIGISTRPPVRPRLPPPRPHRFRAMHPARPALSPHRPAPARPHVGRHGMLTRRELIDRFRHLEPSDTFRNRYQYNNLMYTAAGSDHRTGRRLCLGRFRSHPNHRAARYDLGQLQ